VECDIGLWKKCIVNCEDALSWKVVALTEVEKEQGAMRKRVEERDTELAKVRAELEA
jgi:hypothetical protein